MRVLVTGCGGFLGSEIVRQLLRRGDEVVGISRGDYPALVNAGMEPRRGDLSDPAFTKQAFCDVETVVHTAAVAGVWGSSDYFYQNNQLATELVVQACQSHGVRNLVFTSSPSVTFDGKDQSGVDETVSYPKRWLCHYPRTKAIAEQLVMRSHDPNGLRTVALRPHLIWGEEDPHILPRLLLRAKQGKLLIVGDGENRVDTVHVVNAAGAHLDAIDSLQATPEKSGGRCYFISQDEPVNCWSWISEICRIGRVPPPSRKISARAAYLLGGGFEAIYWMTRRTAEPPMTRFVAAQLSKDHYFDISAAKERLGYKVRLSMQEGLKRLELKWNESSEIGPN